MKKILSIFLYLHLLGIVVFTVLALMNIAFFLSLKLILVSLVGSVVFLSLRQFKLNESLLHKVKIALGGLAYTTIYSLFFFPSLFKDYWSPYVGVLLLLLFFLLISLMEVQKRESTLLEGAFVLSCLPLLLNLGSSTVLTIGFLLSLAVSILAIYRGVFANQK